jgi:N-acetylmuramoyl-L-alanine amidase
VPGVVHTPISTEGFEIRKAVTFVLLAALVLASAAGGVAGLASGPQAAVPPVASLVASLEEPAPAGLGPSGAAETAEQDPDPSEFRLSESDIHLLARLITAEARGQPYAGQVAVGAVVMNRVRSESFPDSVRAAIYQPGQFEPVSNGHINTEPTETALKAARAAAAGEDPSGGALYFFAPAKTSNAFLWNRPHKVTIGDHRFTS